MEDVWPLFLLVLYLDGEQSPILHHLESPALQLKSGKGLEDTKQKLCYDLRCGKYRVYCALKVR